MSLWLTRNVDPISYNVVWIVRCPTWLALILSTRSTAGTLLGVLLPKGLREPWGGLRDHSLWGRHRMGSLVWVSIICWKVRVGRILANSSQSLEDPQVVALRQKNGEGNEDQDETTRIAWNPFMATSQQ